MSMEIQFQVSYIEKYMKKCEEWSGKQNASEKTKKIIKGKGFKVFQ